MVAANGKGVSLVTEARLIRERNRGVSGYIWKLPARFPIPLGLGLHPDQRSEEPNEQPDHYLLCPVSDIPLDVYVSLLSKLALKLERIRKI